MPATQGALLAKFKLSLRSALLNSDPLDLDSLLHTRGAPQFAVDFFVNNITSTIGTARIDTIEVQPTASLMPDPSEKPHAIDSTILNGHHYRNNLRSSGICSIRAKSADARASSGVTFRIGIGPDGHYKIPFMVRQPTAANPSIGAPPIQPSTPPSP